MTETKEHPNLAAALVAALGKLSVVEAGQTADTGSYKYHYASIADVVQVTRPVLAEHGLVALTPVKEHNDGLECTVVLLHESGQSMEFGPFPFPHGRDAQATGSMVTYHRRYALLSALGMGVGDDDDGASAKAKPEPVVEWATKSQLDTIRDEYRQLPEGDRAQVGAWPVLFDVELVKDGKIVCTVEQAQNVLERLEAARSAVGAGDSGQEGGGPEQATAGPDGSKTDTGSDTGVGAPAPPASTGVEPDPVSASSEGPEAAEAHDAAAPHDGAPSDDLPSGPAAARESLEKAQPARRGR